MIKMGKESPKTNVIKYDFKKKVKVLEYKTDKWTCNTCGALHLYDSRNETNEPRVVLIASLGQLGQYPVNMCRTCVMEVNTAMFNKGDDE